MAEVFGDAGGCSSMLLSKYFFGGLATVSSLLPLRGGIVGGARADEAGRRPTPLAVVLDDITGLVVDCLVVAAAVLPLDSLETRLMVEPEET